MVILHTFNLIKEGGTEARRLVSSLGNDHKQPLKGKKMHHFKLFARVYMQHSYSMGVREDDHTLELLKMF